MPQLDLGIYFFQIFINLLFFWFLYFYINFFILGTISNIIKLKIFLNDNNNYIYVKNSIFFNQIEFFYYNSNVWINFHNFFLLFFLFLFKKKKILGLIYFHKINKFLNKFNFKIFKKKKDLFMVNLKSIILL